MLEIWCVLGCFGVCWGPSVRAHFCLVSAGVLWCVLVPPSYFEVQGNGLAEEVRAGGRACIVIRHCTKP